jgi:AhpD family alkylhydroperoxidase
MNHYRIPAIEPAPGNSKQILRNVIKQSGYIPNLNGIMANSLIFLQVSTDIVILFGNTNFTHIEKNIILLTVSHFNKCHYCMAIHTTANNKFNVSYEIMYTIREDSYKNESKFKALRKFTK